MGGPITPEQTVAIIESVAEVVERTPPAPMPDSTPWWQIFAVVGGTIATLLTAWAGYVAVKRRKK